MTTTLTITGPNFTNTIQPPMPAITNLKTLAFFGSAGDGNNANRVAGGPAIVVQAGAPVYAANYVNLGLQASGSRNDVLNTQNPRDATALASGCTWVAVARISQLTGGARGLIFGDTNGTPIGASWMAWVLQNTGAQIAFGNTARATITQAISPVTNWHFYAQTYSGGAAGTFTFYDFTEDAVAGKAVTYVAAGQVVGAQSPHFGAVATPTSETGAQQPIEHAFGLIANSVMSQASLAQLYAWTKANLARRSIAC